MKVIDILAGVEACSFEAWATTKSGVVRRLTFTCTQSEALALAFTLCPGAVAMSLRELDVQLHRRADEVPA